MVQVLQKAPEFKLPGVVGKEFKEISLADYRGQWVVFYFYPLDFTFVCPTEILEFSRQNEEFTKLNARILGASCDSQYSHKAWIDSSLGELAYPLLSDYTKATAKAYGALLEDKGLPTRATFIIDPDGILQYASYNSLSVGRSIEEVLRILVALQTGELCPVGWKKGQKTLGK